MEKKEKRKKEIKIKFKEINLWRVLTILFFVLMVASIFTRGFHVNVQNTTNTVTSSGNVNLIVLNDKRCDSCNSSAVRVVNALKKIFPDLNVKYMDYSSNKGKTLFNQIKPIYLPAFLFDSSVKSASGYQQIQRYLDEKGQYLSLRVGSSFDPTKEICDNGKDDTGNGLVDCADPDCKNSLVCRNDIKNKLDLFVMSYCPYGRAAENSLKQVLENFDNKINLSVHFIANYDKSTDKFSSLHGQKEVNEDLRQVCIMKYYPDNYKYMGYVWCINKGTNADNDWKSCAENNNMSVSLIENCSTSDEGKQLLIDNIKLSNEIGISASPTWLANNRYIFNGIDAKTVKDNFCKYNNLEGCSNNITSNTTVNGQC